MPTLLHIIYVHGFQGNDTTFQAFPRHLQEYLAAHIPPHLDITIQSSLYPTYRSIKPISYATNNFLEWLTTQPPGPVILVGHSMGGLLVAEAATAAFNNPERYSGARPRRIIGVIAFDTPYLGMHPHVIVSGIASLLPKGDEDGKEDEEQKLNDHPDVNFVDQKVTSDWEAFKKQENIHPNGSVGSSMLSTSTKLDRPKSPYSEESFAAFMNPRAHSPSHSSAASMSNSSFRTGPSPPPSPIPAPFMEKAINFVSTVADEPLVRWMRKHADDPFSAGKRWVVERLQFGICMFDPQGLKSRYVRLVDWNQTQGGKFVNYWTETVPKVHPPRQKHITDSEGNEIQQSGADKGHYRNASTATSTTQGSLRDNDEALLANGIVSTKETSSEVTSISLPVPADDPPLAELPETPPVQTAPTKSEAKAKQKAEEKVAKAAEKERRKQEKEREKQAKAEEKAAKEKEKEKEKARLKKRHPDDPPPPKTPRHFVVLPNGLGEYLGGWDNWEKVPIGGVDDEVNAHLGLFIPEHNFDYLGLVERVAAKVLGWCEDIPNVRK